MTSIYGLHKWPTNLLSTKKTGLDQRTVYTGEAEGPYQSQISINTTPIWNIGPTPISRTVSQIELKLLIHTDHGTLSYLQKHKYPDPTSSQAHQERYQSRRYRWATPSSYRRSVCRQCQQHDLEQGRRITTDRSDSRCIHTSAGTQCNASWSVDTRPWRPCNVACRTNQH